MADNIKTIVQNSLSASFSTAFMRLYRPGNLTYSTGIMAREQGIHVYRLQMPDRILFATTMIAHFTRNITDDEIISSLNVSMVSFPIMNQNTTKYETAFFSSPLCSFADAVLEENQNHTIAQLTQQCNDLGWWRNSDIFLTNRSNSFSNSSNCQTFYRSYIAVTIVFTKPAANVSERVVSSDASKVTNRTNLASLFNTTNFLQQLMSALNQTNATNLTLFTQNIARSFVSIELPLCQSSQLVDVHQDGITTIINCMLAVHLTQPDLSYGSLTTISPSIQNVLNYLENQILQRLNSTISNLQIRFTIDNLILLGTKDVY